jgi:hypothetical protein
MGMLILASILVGFISIFVTLGFAAICGKENVLLVIISLPVSIVILWVLKLVFGMALWLAILLSPVLSLIITWIIINILAMVL